MEVQGTSKVPTSVVSEGNTYTTIVKSKSSLVKSLWGRLSRKKIVGIFLFCVLWTTIMTLSLLGYVAQWARALALWGPIAHVLIFFFFVFVSLPFGYGYSIGLIAFGYSLGFEAAPAAIGGFYLGTVMAYVFTRYVAREWALLQIKNVFEKHDIAMDEVLNMVNGNRVKKWVSLFSLRHIALFTLGWSNTLLCIIMLQLREGILPFCFLSFTTELPFIFAYLGIGDSIAQIEKTQTAKEAGELVSESTETQSLRTVVLVAQICCTLFVIGTGCYISRKGYTELKKRSKQRISDESPKACTVSPLPRVVNKKCAGVPEEKESEAAHKAGVKEVSALDIL